MAGEMEREIKDLLARLLAQRDEDYRALREELRAMTAKVGEMDAKVTTLTARDESIAEMRVVVNSTRDDVIKLKTQMAIGSAVAVAVLAAVVALVFRVFAGGG
jgi:predicted RNase H-like nuclease (RuvC/YqgF family)